jgi:hypothetical protein
MRTQTLDKHINIGKFAKGQHVKGHLNGLLFVIGMTNAAADYPILEAWIKNSKLKVKYVEDRVRTLVPSVPVHNFLDLTNKNFGSTNEVGNKQKYFETAMMSSLRNLASMEDNSIDYNFFMQLQETTQSDSKQIQFYVDLGSIYVDGGNELHYELHCLRELAINVEVFSVSMENEPMHFIEYDMDFDRNEMHQNVVASYLCSPANELTFKDIDITVDATSVQYETNTKGLVACVSLFGEVENVSLGRTLPVFEAMDMVPEDVQIKFNSDVTIEGYYILNVRIDTTFKGYIDGKRKAISEKATVIQRLEVNEPVLAEVLQYEGLPTSTELREIIL